MSFRDLLVIGPDGRITTNRALYQDRVQSVPSTLRDPEPEPEDHEGETDARPS